MARVFGMAPAHRNVYALLVPRNAEVPPPVGGLIDQVVADADGVWELALSQTTEHDAYYLVRIWGQEESLYIDVPAGDGTYDADFLAIDPPGQTIPELPPSWQLPDYVLTAALGQPEGVATLGADGLLTASQRPPGGGPGGGPGSHLHSQTEPSTVWLINHPLEFVPSGIEVFDHIDVRHYPDITWPNASTVRLAFDTDVRGTARLS